MNNEKKPRPNVRGMITRTFHTTRAKATYYDYNSKALATVDAELDGAFADEESFVEALNKNRESKSIKYLSAEAFETLSTLYAISPADFRKHGYIVEDAQ